MNKIVILLTLLVSLNSCLQKNVANNQATTNTGSTGSGSGGTGGGGGSGTGGGGGAVTCPMGTGGEPGVADAGQTFEYFKIKDPKIVAHGAGSGAVVWSSEVNLSTAYSQTIFSTNTRFNVRVIPRRTNATVDSKGVACKFQNPPRPFSKMQVGVRVRKQGVTYGDYYLFNDVPVDCASGVHSFAVPQGTTTPLVIEILDVKWDWSCTDYANQGHPNVPGVCPWDKVWNSECYALELEFSTDTTKDLPGPKVY